MRPKTYLACMGDATHANAWSSIPYHLLDAARPAGWIDEGLVLRPELPVFRRMRVAWNAWSLLTGRGRGGFQFSPAFLERLWRPVFPLLRVPGGSRVINHFQLYPRTLLRDPGVEKWFYIDSTLTQLIRDYEFPVPRARVEEIARREREGYQRARGIMVMAHYAARSLADDYKIPPEKVHVLVPGANFSSAQYALLEPLLEAPPLPAVPGRELRLLVIGREWHRKGVDRLVDAILAGRQQGLRCSLRVLGCQREELPERYRQVPGVEFLGFISRKDETKRFVELVLDNDLGCLLSRAECAGIAIREYLSLGMPVIASTVGGLPDMCDPDCCVMVQPGESVEQIGRRLLDLQARPADLSCMREVARARRRTRLWDTTVKHAMEFWPGFPAPQ